MEPRRDDPAPPSPPPAAPATPHLLPALAAVLTLLLATGGVELFVRVLLPAHMDRFTLTMSPAKLTGNVLQTAAFETAGMLPVYGSSELDRPADNRPDAFFLKRPTGFSAFPIGRADNTSLIILQKLAAAGPAARGKKVAVILSASWFLRSLDGESLDRNLRPLQLGSWIFGHGLHRSLKRDLAQRLLTYPKVVEEQPVLGLALESLADKSAFNRLRLALLTPVGRLQNFLLQRMEYWAILRDMPSFFPTSRQREQARRQRFLASPATAPDWDALTARAEVHERAYGSADPYGVGEPAPGDAVVTTGPAPREPGTLRNQPPPPDRDADFRQRMAKSGEWGDLALLLRGLHDLGARALIIDQPFNGLYSEAGGNSAGVRRGFYDQLERVVHTAGFPLVDLSGHERDRYFFNDYNHPSAKGWLYYDHALDDFYHGRSGGPTVATPHP